MSPELKERIQWLLALGLCIAALRAGYIFYQRHESQATPAKTAPPPLEADYYVTPKKLHPYDLKSARELTQQPVWVRMGYAYTYYPYSTARHHADFDHPAGLLLPLEKLQIQEVGLDTTPKSPGERQVIAIFEKNGNRYAFSIGSEQSGNYQIYSDDMLFIQDPHELYKHWTADTWQAIDNHAVKPGMNELQASFAIGLGVPQGNGNPGDRTLQYPNGGNPLSVTFSNGKAVQIKPGANS
jgi:hypothetical protein